MTPKEKAFGLIVRFKSNVYKKAFTDTDFMYDRYYGLDDEMVKQCALIAVDEIIEATSIKYEFRDAELFYAGKKPMQYWLDVKKEIEKL